LFAVACCRRVAEHIPDIALAEVIDACERLAEELNADDWSRLHIDRLRKMADRVEATRLVGAEFDRDHYEFGFAVGQLTGFPIYPADCADSCMHALCGHDDYDTGRGEVLFQADLLRDIVGNPFRPVTFSPSWRTDTTVSLARTMYESREFAAMPILADALQDAGCDSAAVLDHGRDPEQVHVRGCWVLGGRSGAGQMLTVSSNVGGEQCPQSHPHPHRTKTLRRRAPGGGRGNGPASSTTGSANSASSAAGASNSSAGRSSR
jgi:hypothetical protein